jgi:hypothetical protein
MSDSIPSLGFALVANVAQRGHELPADPSVAADVLLLDEANSAIDRIGAFVRRTAAA